DAFTGSHHYSCGGIFRITVTVRDDDGGEASRSTIAVVSGVGLANGILYVVGTDARDLVQIDQVTVMGRPVLRVRVQFSAGQPANFYFDPSAVRLIVVLAGAGNDCVTIAREVHIDSLLLGGPGHDHLRDGGGHEIDGHGNDHLFSRHAAQVLISVLDELLSS